MKKLLTLLVLFLFSISHVYCEEVTDSTLVLGFTKSASFIGKNIYSSCSLSDTKYIDASTFLIIIGTHKCYSEKYYKVLYKNEVYYIETKELLFAKNINYFDLIDKLPEDSKIKFEENAKYTSSIHHHKKFLDAIDFLKSCKTKGLAILKWNIYDESEYTDGTSVEFSFYNPTAKVIKYIWVNLVGYNPVKDKVIDRGTSLKTVKCVGPIEPDAGGKYSFEYVWFTDIVDNAKITSIKVQYIDGTIKTITAANSVQLDYDLYKYCFDN